MVKLQRTDGLIAHRSRFHAGLAVLFRSVCALAFHSDSVEWFC